MTGLSLSLSRARRRGGFSPLELSEVTGWLRIAGWTDTGTLSIPDMRGGPALTQSVAGNKPTIGVAGNGRPILTFASGEKWLNHAASAASNNSSPRNGLGFWFRPAAVNTTYALWSAWLGAGGNGSRMVLRQQSADLGLYVYVSSNSTQRLGLSSSAPLAAAAWRFCTYEFDGGQTAEADKAIVTVNNAKLTLGFSDAEGTPGAMPTTLRSFGVSAAFGNQNISFPSQLFVGDVCDLYWLGGAGGLSGGGLLTTEKRAQLMAHDPPI